MKRVLILTVLLVSVLMLIQAQTVTSGQALRDLVGTWEGKYGAGQGETGLTLTVYEEGGNYKAIFDFYNLPGRSNAANGKYYMNVSYNTSTRRYSLIGYEWIIRPDSYNFADLEGTLTGDVFSGSTYNFRVVRTAVSGSYRYSTNTYITFTGSNFTGSWNASTPISGTFSVSGSMLTLNITGGPRARNTWTWTIVDANTLRDQDGDSWRKEVTDVRTVEDYENSGWEAFYRGDYDQAIADFTQAIRLDPNYYWAYSNRGYVHINKGNYDLAIEDCTQAIRLDPNLSIYPYNNRGYAYLQKGDYDRAITDFTQVIRIDPNYAFAYNDRGLTYEKKGNFSLALMDFIVAFRLDTTNECKAVESIERILVAAPSLAGARVLWTVNNASSWIEAVNGIRSGGENKVHSITVSGNFTIPMSDSNTFGSVAKIAVIMGGSGTISPSSNGSVLQIGNEQTVIVKDLTLQGRDNNNRSVVVVERGGIFRMEGNASVKDNKGGGGVSVYDSGTFVMQDNTTVSGNTFGGVLNSGTFIMRDKASVSGNTAGAYDNGGGVLSRGTFTMRDSASVMDNTGGSMFSHGGGVCVAGGTFTMLDNTSVSSNTTGGNGGGVCVVGGTFIMQGNASVSGNTANYGGGVDTSDGTFIMLDNTLVSGNNASDGGGVYNNLGIGTFTMQDSASVSNNTARGDGGGVSGSLIMEGGTISGNTARDGGGVKGSLTMKGGTISGNTSRRYGGGVCVEWGTFNMQDGVISGNTANEQGGGVYLGVTLTKTGGTIYGNDAEQNLRNTVTGQNGRGHAIYDGSNSRWRSTTIGPTVNPETYGFWLND